MAKTKKDYDKEYMYKKIMPSAFLEDEPAKIDTKAEDSPPTPVAKTEADPAKSIQQNGFGAKKSVSFETVNNSVLVNIVEHVVASKINDVFARMNCCKCDRCKKDAAALALNTLTPKYVVCDPEKIDILAASLNDREATAAILKAVLTVRKNPRH